MGDHHRPVAVECRLRHRYVGQWHLGSHDGRLPNDRGFGEWYGIPRTTDEAAWPSSPGYSPQIVPLEKIMEGKKGEKSRALKDYDLEQRRLIDAEVTKRSVAFIERQAKTGRPFFAYVALTQPHLPSLPNPIFSGKTGNGDWADTLTEIDYNVGQVLDVVDKLGIRDNTIVIFTSDNGAEFFKPWDGWVRPLARHVRHRARRRSSCAVHRPPAREDSGWPHQQRNRARRRFVRDLAKFAGANVPDDRPIDSLDQSDFFLGKSEKSAREGFPIWNSNVLMGVKWRNWKLHFYKQDTPIDPPLKLGVPFIINLYTDRLKKHRLWTPGCCIRCEKSWVHFNSPRKSIHLSRWARLPRPRCKPCRAGARR